ncbi:hypothetical protein MAR_020983 [Mya arenaria]|uniref:Uncharacterized protein n=1 Tax=Mya arenaria TaxID=6604 RepID=A0ABY7EB17_MYAAR|nr:uncharacterized protein LOC128233474 [Mya arenaria]WAR05614.1 hypothetical protein MAR_020983 [Mya arenaria]
MIKMKHTMEYKLLASLLIIAVLQKWARSEERSCGNVRGDQNEDILKLRFYPSPFFVAHITYNHRRWLFESAKRAPIIVIPLKDSPKLDPKYNESGNFLTVYNISAADNGQYFLDCWQSGLTLQSSRWTFTWKMPETTHVSTVTTTHRVTMTDINGDSTKSDPPVGSVLDVDSDNSVNISTGPNIATVVAIVMAAIIVVVIVVGSVLIVRRNRQHKRHDAALETEKPTARILPKRPDQGVPTSSCEDQYAKIQDCRSSVNPASGRLDDKRVPPEYESVTPTFQRKQTTWTGTINNAPEYSQVIPKSQRNHNAEGDTRNTSPEYSHVIPKSQRRLDMGKETKAAEYSQVIPKSQRHNTIGDEARSKTFSVTFPPNVDVSKLGTELPRGSGDAYANYGPTYSNITGQVLVAARSFRRKSRIKHRELHYAALDCTDPTADAGHYDCIVDIHRKSGCQYASIDFEKKAFIAPVRRAPSSWYRHQKRRKSTVNKND